MVGRFDIRSDIRVFHYHCRSHYLHISDCEIVMTATTMRTAGNRRILLGVAMILAAVIGFVIIWSLNDNKIQGKGETIVKSKANTYKTSGDLLRALAKADKTVTVGGFAPDPAATLSGGKSVTGPLTWSALPNNPTYMVGVTIFKNNAAL